MKNNITPLLFLSIIMSTGSNGQTKPIGDEPLNLESFNFDTKISDLYPDKNISKNHKDSYEIKSTAGSNLVLKERTVEDEYDEDPKAISIEYRQQSSTSTDALAVFENQKFQKINVATTIKGKIKVINAVAEELTAQLSKDLIKKLVNKYGKAKKLKNKWNEEFSMYEWIENDRIIRFVSAFNDESATLKFVIDKEKQTITSGEKKPHYVGYLFIINPALKDEVYGKMKVGDFNYLDGR